MSCNMWKDPEFRRILVRGWLFMFFCAILGLLFAAYIENVDQERVRDCSAQIAPATRGVLTTPVNRPGRWSRHDTPWAFRVSPDATYSGFYLVAINRSTGEVRSLWAGSGKKAGQWITVSP